MEYDMTPAIQIQPFDLKNSTQEQYAALNTYNNRLRAERLPDDPPVPLEETIQNLQNVPAFVDEIQQEWAAKYGEGEPYNTDALVTYDQAWAFVQVLEKAQSVDPKVVADTFDTLTKPGDIKSIFGDAYMGGSEVLGVNRVLIRPQPLTIVDENAQIKFLKYMTAVPPGS